MLIVVENIYYKKIMPMNVMLRILLTFKTAFLPSV